MWAVCCQNKRGIFSSPKSTAESTEKGNYRTESQSCNRSTEESQYQRLGLIDDFLISFALSFQSLWVMSYWCYDIYKHVRITGSIPSVIHKGACLGIPWLARTLLLKAMRSWTNEDCSIHFTQMCINLVLITQQEKILTQFWNTVRRLDCQHNLWRLSCYMTQVIAHSSLVYYSSLP